MFIIVVVVVGVVVIVIIIAIVIVIVLNIVAITIHIIIFSGELGVGSFSLKSTVCTEGGVPDLCLELFSGRGKTVRPLPPFWEEVIFSRELGVGTFV